MRAWRSSVPTFGKFGRSPCSDRKALVPMALAAQPLTVDSTVGELLDNPAAHKVLEHQVPALINPQIEQARPMSLRSLQTYIPNLLTDPVLKSIDEELSRTPGAVASANPPRPITPISRN